MAGRIGGFIAAAAMALALGPARAAQPSLTPAQVISLFATAGFPLGPDKRPLNRCRQPADPKVSFVDMNGDGRVEALFIDEGPCYRPDRRWSAVAAQSPDGAWRRILEGEGCLHATGDLARMVRPGRDQWREHERASLRRPRLCVSRSRAGRGRCAGAGRRCGVAFGRGGRAQGRPLSDRRMESAGQVAELPPAEQASIMKAAGFKRVGKAWKGCEGSWSVEKDGVEIKDLNGDGRPEAVIAASGYECYGNAGQGFTVLRAVPGGWKTIAGETGIRPSSKSAAPRATRTSRSAAGTCFPVERWNGKSYRVIGRRADEA